MFLCVSLQRIDDEKRFDGNNVFPKEPPAGKMEVNMNFCVSKIMIKFLWSHFQGLFTRFIHKSKLQLFYVLYTCSFSWLHSCVFQEWSKKLA